MWIWVYRAIPFFFFLFSSTPFSVSFLWTHGLLIFNLAFISWLLGTCPVRFVLATIIIRIPRVCITWYHQSGTDHRLWRPGTGIALQAHTSYHIPTVSKIDPPYRHFFFLRNSHRSFCGRPLFIWGKANYRDKGNATPALFFFFCLLIIFCFVYVFMHFGFCLCDVYLYKRRDTFIACNERKIKSQ